MSNYEPLSTKGRLIAAAAAVVSSTAVLVAALTPFALDSGMGRVELAAASAPTRLAANAGPVSAWAQPAVARDDLPTTDTELRIRESR